jgi:hypothetical protein
MNPDFAEQKRRPKKERAKHRRWGRVLHDGSIVGFVEEKYDAMIPAACGVRIPR